MVSQPRGQTAINHRCSPRSEGLRGPRERGEDELKAAAGTGSRRRLPPAPRSAVIFSARPEVFTWDTVKMEVWVRNPEAQPRLPELRAGAARRLSRAGTQSAWRTVLLRAGEEGGRRRRRGARGDREGIARGSPRDRRAAGTAGPEELCG